MNTYGLPHSKSFIVYIYNSNFTSMKKKLLYVSFILSIGIHVSAQDKINWYNNGRPGMETEKAYKMLKKKKAKDVIVAVLDSGVDVEHEDLQGQIWVNQDEVAGNGVDDDLNGYIDDVNGWNFLGNAKGENIHHASMEKARYFNFLAEKYEGLDRANLRELEQNEYDVYQELMNDLETERSQYEEYLVQINEVYKLMEVCPTLIAEALGKTNYTFEELEKWEPTSDELYQAQRVVLGMLSGELTNEALENYEKEYRDKLETTLNPSYNDRALIGDDPTNFGDKFYGNNNVEGPDALHGTHVAGIIGAKRKNKLGGDGVASAVKIMSVRVVPDGDENDKDVALGIRYAVDNGAQVINMSFGKAYSPYQQEVYDALAYADSKGVLVIHAAGNDSKNIDVESNFPTSMYDFQDAKLNHYITVGASSDMKAPNLVAYFSNVGSQSVDVFAPGTEIYSTVPNNAYESLQGTSMAAPMVAGAAAFLKSYFPEIPMVEIGNILVNHGVSYADVMQVNPSTETEEKFQSMCRSGNVVNLVEAVKACQKYVAQK